MSYRKRKKKKNKAVCSNQRRKQQRDRIRFVKIYDDSSKISFIRYILCDIFSECRKTDICRCPDVPLFFYLSTQQKFYQLSSLLKGIMMKDTPLPKPTFLNLSTLIAIFDYLFQKTKFESFIQNVTLDENEQVMDSKLGDEEDQDINNKEHGDEEHCHDNDGSCGDSKQNLKSDLNRKACIGFLRKQQRKIIENSKQKKNLSQSYIEVRKEFRSKKNRISEKSNSVSSTSDHKEMIWKKYEEPKYPGFTNARGIVLKMMRKLIEGVRGQSHPTFVDQNPSVVYCDNEDVWYNLILALMNDFVKLDDTTHVGWLWCPIIYGEIQRERSAFIYSLVKKHRTEFNEQWTYESTIRSDAELVMLLDGLCGYPLTPPRIHNPNNFTCRGRELSPEGAKKREAVQKFIQNFFYACEDDYSMESRMRVLSEMNVEDIVLYEGDYDRKRHPNEQIREGMFKEFFECSGCGVKEEEGKKFKVCASCKVSRYCSRECQKVDWKKGHRKECKIMGENFSSHRSY